MLIQEVSILEEETHPMLKLILQLTDAADKTNKEVAIGIYELASFNMPSSFPDELYETYPSLDTIGCYGVCDNYQQILDQCPELVSSTSRKFVIALTPVIKSQQSEEGGWRWHKWGDYIGTQNPQYEYIYDELFIEKVYCYHIYEKKS